MDNVEFCENHVRQGIKRHEKKILQDMKKIFINTLKSIN
jgi:hypothetical protein